MKFHLPACVAALLAAGAVAPAIDVDPSKQTVPRKFFDPPGKGLNLFAGDPKRVDRANTIYRKDFDVALSIEPNPVLVPASAQEPLPQVRVALMVKNIAKRPKTLSFSNSQRVDVLVRSPEGGELYRWSADKKFVEAAGTSIIMPQEKVAFPVDIPLGGWSARPKPGQNVVFAGVVAGYPEFLAETNVVLAVGTPQPPAPPALVQGSAPAVGALPRVEAPRAPVPAGSTMGLSPVLSPAAGPASGFSLGTGAGGSDVPAAPGAGAMGLDPLPMPLPER